jgi:hypothetical protein
MMRITEHPETEDEEQIPTFCEMDKNFTDRRVSVIYSTSYQKQAGKIIKYATVHWVSVSPSLADFFTNDQPQEALNWLVPRTIKHPQKTP